MGDHNSGSIEDEELIGRGATIPGTENDDPQGGGDEEDRPTTGRQGQGQRQIGGPRIRETHESDSHPEKPRGRANGGNAPPASRTRHTPAEPRPTPRPKRAGDQGGKRAGHGAPPGEWYT